MPELEIVPHPEQQRTYAELREEFRAENLSRVRAQFAGYHPIGWSMIGDPTRARDGFNADQWAYEMLCHLDSPVVQDFGLGSVPKSFSLKLETLAQKAAIHDSVTWEEGEDQDAAACKDVTTMTDDELADYVESSIKESARG